MNNQTIAKRIKQTTAPPSVIDAVTELIAENERLTDENERMASQIEVFHAELSQAYEDLSA